MFHRIVVVITKIHGVIIASLRCKMEATHVRLKWSHWAKKRGAPKKK